MNTYDFSIDLTLFKDGNAIGQITGTVQADRYSTACTLAWKVINGECQSLKDEGYFVAAGDLHVTVRSEVLS